MPSKKLAISRQQADLVSDICDIHILQGTELLVSFFMGRECQVARRCSQNLIQHCFDLYIGLNVMTVSNFYTDKIIFIRQKNTYFP
jgi:hypothetical protein